MSDNVTVSNSPTSINTDIPVRTLDKGGEQVQVMTVDWGGAGAENLTVPDFATETTLSALEGKDFATENTLQSINAAIAGGLYFNITTNSDILGVSVGGRRNNEIELSFFDSFDANLINNTHSTTGSATITAGHAQYSTGTNTNGASRGETIYKCNYRPAHEEYAFFTAAFTTGIANSYQRIGIYDTDNGAFIGYEGTSFGVTLRSGTSDTRIARTSWNGDPLDGSVGSIFTRAGTPEAINLAYSNLYRIRFAWLGSASFIFEVFSPDAKWVTFHTIRIPNSQLAPSIQTPNLGMKLECVKSGGGATNLSIYTACWAAGTTSDYNPVTETLTDYSMANLTRAIIAGRSSTGGGTYYNVKVNPSGSLITAIGDITGIVGQNTMANSLPVAIASNQTAIPVTDNGGSLTVDGTVAATQSGTWNINNVSGTISLPTGAATETTLSTLNGKVTACNTGAVTISTALPAGTNNIGDVDVLTLPDVALKNYSTSAVTSVVSAATSTSVLASNANRRMAIMVNDTDRNTYVKLGATASTTSFSYKLSPGQILELPIPIYTGAIDAIWDASPTGSMRVTEIT